MDTRGLIRSAFLKSNAVRNCFLSLPERWYSSLPLSSLPTFSLESSKSSLTVTWNGMTHSCSSNGEEMYVSISASLLASSGFQEDELIVVRQVAVPPPCREVAVQVRNLVEWEELFLNFQGAQEAFLNQIRVVASGQMIPLWLDGGSLINLKVQSLTPSLPLGLLMENTQVKVFPPSDEAKNYSSSLPAKVLNIQPASEEKAARAPRQNDQNFEVLKYVYKGLVTSLLGWCNDPVDPRPLSQDVTLSLRVVPFPSLDLCNSSLEVLEYHPSFVMVNKSILVNSRFENDFYFYANLRKVSYFKDPQSAASPKNETANADPHDYCVVVLVWENVKEKLASTKDERIISCFHSVMTHHSCIVSPTLRRHLSIKIKSIINLSTHGCITHKDVNSFDTCSLLSHKMCQQLLNASLKNHLTDICDILPVIVNPFTLVSFPIEKKFVDVFLIVRSKRVIVVDEMVIRSLQVRPISIPPSALPFVHKSFEELDGIPPLKPFHQVNDDLTQSIKRRIIGSSTRNLLISHFRPEFMLLLGSKGSGKTIIAKSLMNEISAMPHNFYCEILKMKKLKGKKVDSVQKSLKEILHRGIFYQPSLIILDDLDLLVQRTSEGDGNPSIEYFDHLALMIKNLLQQLRVEMELRSFSRENHPSEISLTILATSLSLDSLHVDLASSQGFHLFSSIFSIEPLSDGKRLAFFEALLLKFYKDLPNYTTDELLKSSSLDVNADLILCYDRKSALNALGGLTLRDIDAFALRVFFEAKSRLKSHLVKSRNLLRSLTYTDEDIQSAQVNFIPLSKKALKVAENIPKKIDVGGLSAARTMLEETINWPSRYPNLFNQSSLRLRSGILLYGPPGCGKTILVNYVAKNSNLNYITVKGPELLSKYIGQSEKAVRDAFERAQAAKPCILFFDEFDSIAPRRGHDNTGVTDRVVNQLLTQMDGVEGLSGVYVLAATSRPDLIDPALLRPGRLDKCIHCPLPKAEERQEILVALSKDMSMQEEMDWHTFAQLTEEYSGADLQGVLSTAQIKAVQEYLGDSLYEGILNVDAERNVQKQNAEEPEVASHGVSGSSSPSGAISSKRNMEGLKQVDSMQVKQNITDDSKTDLRLKKTSAKVEECSVTNSDHEIPLDVTPDPPKGPLRVKREHLYQALKDVKPSIKKSDRAFYEKIYETFINSRDSKVFASFSPGKLKTFA